MAQTQLEFGYFPHELSVTVASIKIDALPGLREISEAVKGSDGVDRGWIYAPRAKSLNFGGRVTEHPYPSRVFGLPKTHVLSHAKATGNDHLDFIVWCLGFLVGMRLTTTEAGFVDAAPIERSSLTDFNASHSDIVAGVEVADMYWHKAASGSGKAKLIVAMINALFLAQNPLLLQYERFFHLYAALDTCFALLSAANTGAPRWHSQRVSWMCKLFGMEVPEWAQVDGTSSEVSALRNPTFHEALFSGEPLGFALYMGKKHTSQDENMLLEMEALISRFVVAALGRPTCPYVVTAIGTRQMHSLDLTKDLG